MLPRAGNPLTIPGRTLALALRNQTVTASTAMKAKPRTMSVSDISARTVPCSMINTPVGSETGFEQMSFGPQVVFQKAPPAGQSNLPPSAGFQFFGQVDIDASSHDLVVQLKDTARNSLFSQRLDAHPVDGWRDAD